MKYKDIEVGHLLVKMNQDQLHAIEAASLIKDALIKMEENNISSLIVFHDDGKWAGILTETDLRRAWLNGADQHHDLVGKFMTAADEVTSVKMSTKVEDARRTIVQIKKKHLPVVDKEGRPVNMLSVNDLVAAPEILQFKIDEVIDGQNELLFAQ